MAYLVCFHRTAKGERRAGIFYKHLRNKEVEESLAKQYRDIGIKAVAAAVKPGNKYEVEARGRKPVLPNAMKTTPNAGRAKNE